MKNSTIIIIIASLFSSFWFGARAEGLEINAPAFSNKEVVVIMFNGLAIDTLLNSWLDEKGKVIVPIKKEGFILIKLDGKHLYPMFYSTKENKFNLKENGRPDFAGYSQNSFFFRQLILKQSLISKQRVLNEAMMTFSKDDSLIRAFKMKQSSNERKLKQFESLYIDSSEYTGAILISSLQLIETSYSIRSEEELVKIKREFRRFIQEHYNSISSSDMLQQLANQYMMMNEYVIVGKEKMENQIAQDITDWIQLLKEHYSDRDVVQYFLKYFISRTMVTMTAAIYEKLPDLSACPVQNGQVNNKNAIERSSSTEVDATTLAKLIKTADQRETVFIAIDVDCPASIAGQVLLTRVITQNKIPVNVITAFCGRAPEQPEYRIIPDARNPIFLKNGLTILGKTDVKITKYPVFILINSSGQIISIDYTLGEIREKLMKMKNAE